MSVVAFKMIAPLQTPWATPVRLSLSSLMGGSSVESSRREVEKGIRHAMSLWRERVSELHDLQWDRVSTRSRMLFAMNCPPYGFYTDRRDLLPCDRRVICPFCWCRSYSVPAYEKLMGLYRQLGGDCELQELLATHRFPPSDVPGQPLAGIFSWIAQLKGKIVKQKMRRCYGAFILCVVEPDGAGWLMRHNVLALQPPGVALPSCFPKPKGFTTTRDYTRRKLTGDVHNLLAASVGRATLYPASLLTASTERVLEMLQARDAHGESDRGVRMGDFYGQLRKIKPNRKEPDVDSYDTPQAGPAE